MNYQIENFRVQSPLMVAYVTVFRWPLHPYHSLCSPDMLLNVSEFPICISFGDRDYLGSEGADMVIKTNKFFATGESQLIRVENCGH